MKKYAADNLMFLREQYPDIYRIVRNQTYDRNQYRIEPSKNGLAGLFYRSDEGLEYSLYSRYDPVLESQRWAESLDETVLRSDDVLMVGFGFGYHAKAFLSRYPDKRLYIYEPDREVFLAAVEATDLRDLLGNRRIAMFAIGEEEFVLKQLLLGMYKSIKGVFGFTVVPYCRKMHPTLEKTIEIQVPKLALSFGVDMKTISRYKTEWLENTILNMERNLKTPSFYPLKDSCQGLPAIIVGSGPSLGEQIDQLRELKNHAFIIAAGSSVQGLLHHGIEPHLVVSMDGGLPNERVFSNLDIGHIPFLYIPSIKYTAVKDDRSPYLMHGFFDVDAVSHYFMELTPLDGVVASTSSVTGTCIQVAAHLGVKEIAFIGQDFSYPGERMYTDGVNHHHETWTKKEVSNAELTVENVSGGFNRTTYSLLNLKQDVESVIKAFPNITFCNASRVGAKIDRTIEKPLERYLEEYRTLSVDEFGFKAKVTELPRYSMERIGKILTKINQTSKHVTELESYLHELNRHLQRKEPDISLWLSEFENLWKPIVEHPIHVHFLSFFLTVERNYTERYWDDMYHESNLRLKKEKLMDCVRPLMEGLQKLVPLIERYITQLSEKMKE